MKALVALTLAVAGLVQCGGGSSSPDCTSDIGYSSNGYGVREVRCVKGPGTMVASWDCVRDGLVVSRPPSARKSFASSATFAVSCWSATPRIVSLYP